MAAPSSAPTNLNATATGPIIIVSWAATAGATRYAIFRRPVGGSWGTGEIAIVGSQRYFHDWDVTANTNYEYSVQAGNADGFGPHPSSSQRPTAHSHGSADDVMSITIANSGDNVLLTPSAYSYGGGVGTRGYDFFRRKTGDSRSSQQLGGSPHSDHDSTRRRFTDSTVEAGVTYDYFAVAVANNSQRRFHTGVSTHRAPGQSIAAPGVPTSVAATANSATQITFSWSAPSSGGAVTSYEVQWKLTSASSWSDSADDTSTVLFTNLAAATSYSFRVRASNSGGTSAWATVTRSTQTQTATLATPSPPTSVAAAASSDTVIRVTWSAPTAAPTPTGYQVRWRRTGTASWSGPTSTTNAHLDVTGLTANTTYQFQVRSVNTTPTSAWAPSTPATATTQNPAAFITARVVGASIVVTWQNFPGQSDSIADLSRHVGARSTNTADFSGINQFIGSPYTDTDLVDGQSYTYRVQARTPGTNPRGYGAVHFSNTVTFGASSAPGVPRSVAAAATDNDTIRLSWLAPNTGGFVATYDIRYRKSGTTQYSTTTATGDSTSHQISGLDADSIYQIQIRARNSAGSSAYTPSGHVTARTSATAGEAEQATPSAPTRLVADARSDGVHLEWRAPEHAGTGGAITGYNIWRWHKSNKWTEIESNRVGTTPSYIDDDNLIEGEWYMYILRAINGSGRGDWSETFNVLINPDLASAPRGFTADAQSSGVVMNWSTPVDAGRKGPITGYNIQRRDGDDWVDVVANTGTVNTKYTDTTDYRLYSTQKFAVRAINAGGPGEWSNTSTALINPDKPSAPLRFTVDARVGGVFLDWLAPADSGTGGAVSGYNIWRRHSTGTWQEIVGNTGSTSTSYTDTAELNIGDYYLYAIRAINASGPGEWADVKRVNINPDRPSAPLRLTADANSQGVVLKWIVPEHSGTGGAVTGYNVWRRDNGVWRELIEDTQSTATEFVDTTPLTKNRYYQYVVRARNSAGPGDWSNVVSIPYNPGRPSAPRRFTADSQSAGVVMTWLEPEDPGTGGVVTGYQLWRWYKVSGWQLLVSNTASTDTTYTDTSTDVIEGEKYWYIVAALNALGRGDWSETSSAIINPQLPSAPRRLTADARSTGVVLNWETPADPGLGGAITGYAIYRRHQNTDDWTQIEDDTNSTGTKFTDTTTLTAADSYHYAVRAINPAGEGEWSESATAVINPNVPSAPLRLTLDESGSGATLTWEAPEDAGTAGPITGYRIMRRHDDGAWQELVANTGSTSTSYSDTTAGDTGWYWWAVRALNSDGAGEWSNIVGLTFAEDVPGAPHSLLAREHNNDVILNWDEPLNDGGSDITGYRVWRSNGLRWTLLTSDTRSTATTYTDPGAVALGDGNFHYRVAALNANGQGDFSNVATVTVTGEAPNTPDAPSLTIVSSNVIRAVWTAPTTGAEPTAYSLRWRAQDATVWQTDETAVSPFEARDLNASTIYTFQLRAVNSEGASEWSDPATATTNDPEPVQSRSFWHNDVTVDTPGVIWKDIQASQLSASGNLLSLFNAAFTATRSAVQLDSAYVTGATDAWVGQFNLYNRGAGNSWGYLLQLTDSEDELQAEAALRPTFNIPDIQVGIAMRNANGDEYITTLDAAIQSSIIGWPTGGFNDITDHEPIQLIFVDMQSGNIDWPNLETRGSLEPAVPAKPKLKMITNTSLRVTWEANPRGATPTAYDVQHKTSDESEWTTTTDAETPLLLEDLTTLATYQVRVRAKIGPRRTQWSQTSELHLDPALLLLSADFHEPSHNGVFAHSWVAIKPTVNNPDENELTYAWTTSDGLNIHSPDTLETFIQMPPPMDEAYEATATLTLTDTVTNATSDNELTFNVLPQIRPPNSLFNKKFHMLSETPGLAWGEFTQPRDADGTTQLINSGHYETRALHPMSPDYVDEAPAYVTWLSLNDDGSMSLYIGKTADAENYGAESGPGFPNDLLANMAIAIIVPNEELDLYRYSLNVLKTSDLTEPYHFSVNTVRSAGPNNTIVFRRELADHWQVGVLIADTQHENINWELVATWGTWGEWMDIPDSDADTVTHTVGDLTVDIQHAFQIRARNPNGFGPESNEATATPAAD